VSPTPRGLVSFALVVALGWSALTPASAAEARELKGRGWVSWIRGNRADSDAVASGGVFMEGGRTDRRGGWKWFLARAGFGDIVVLERRGDHVYNFFANRLADVDSVQTFRITKRAAAFDPYVVRRIRRAEGLFFAGGDQSYYVDLWLGTPLDRAIDRAVASGTVVGGISAGLAVLGAFVFSAEKGTIDSDTALKDPFGGKVTLRRDFLDVPLLDRTITDSHFAARERQGRMVTFLARIVADGWHPSPRGIGIDEDTAVLVGADGGATVIGRGSAWLFSVPGPPEICRPKTPLTYRDLTVLEARTGHSFDANTWTGDLGPPLTVSAEAGTLIWS
jgi:cyanophycinase